MADAEKNEEFKRLVNLRMNNILKQINAVGNLSDMRHYSYSKAEYTRIVQALKKAVANCEMKFRHATDPNVMFEL